MRPLLRRASTVKTAPDESAVEQPSRSGRVNGPPYARWGPYPTPAAFAREWLFSWSRYSENVGRKFGDESQAWQHYVTEGQYEGSPLSPFLTTDFARRMLKIDSSSDIFAAWADAPLTFSPTPLFDARHYMITHRDVRLSGLDAFAHWLMFGIFEGRSPSAGVELNILNVSGHTARRDAVHSFSTLDELMERNASRAVINVQALRPAFPACVDVTAAVLAGEIAFCTDPQILFGDVGDAFVNEPRLFARLGGL